MTVNADDLRLVNEGLIISSVRAHEAHEASLRETAQLSALLGTLSEGVVITDGDGRVGMVNDTARRTLGIGAAVDLSEVAEKIRALDMRRLDLAPLPPGERPLARAMRGETFVDAESLLVRSDGSVHRFAASGTCTKNGDRVVLAIVVLRDVTDRAQIEQRLAQTERLAAIGTLSAGLAHEINNPLAYVSANVDYALDAIPTAHDRLQSLGSEEATAVAVDLAGITVALGEAQHGCSRIGRIVRDVGRFGRLDESEREDHDLRDILDGAIRLAENSFRERATVRREYQSSPCVHANAGQLGQVFINLLMNAAQAVDDEREATAEIVVTLLTDASGAAVVEVRDSGPGVPLEMRGRIFDPFFTTKPVGKGSGLGLSICHGIVTALGGEITVAGKPGEGAIFRVTLPTVGQESAPQLSSSLEHLDGSKRRARILVIDDEPAIGRAIDRLLHRDHDIVFLSDARQALVLLASDSAFDLVLCDLMMPGMSGIGFYEALRATNPELATGVVFWTGGALSEQADAFVRDARNTMLQKPVTRDVLVQLVAERMAPGRKT